MTAACQAKLDPDIEAAFMAHYGLDVLDPGVTPRRVHVLAHRLPAGAWTNPESPASWSVEAHLLAAVLDATNQLTWAFVSSKSRKGRAPKRPRPTPRPGDQSREERRPKTMMEVMREVAGSPGIKVVKGGQSDG